MEINLTENSYIYNKALVLANNQIAKAIKILKEKEHMWNESFNLKLYDACTTDVDFELNDAMVKFDDNQQTAWFHDFCEVSYEDFQMWAQEEYINLNDLLNYIGRTSSFYIGKLNSDSLITSLIEASPELYDSPNLVLEDENGVVKIDVEKSMEYSEDIEDFVNALLSLADCVVDEVNESLKDIEKVYDYINDFKKNQVEYFKDFVRECWICNV